MSEQDDLTPNPTRFSKPIPSNWKDMSDAEKRAWILDACPWILGEEWTPGEEGA